MKKLLLLSLTLISTFALASELNVPNQFEDGQVTSAEQMNANFEAIQAAVNDNHARIESMQQPTKAVFQGFTTNSVNGGPGLIVMQQACHNFIPGSHICNTTEFAESPYNAEAVATMTENAWILPDFIEFNSSWGATKQGRKIDYGTIRCNEVSNDYGMLLDTTGHIHYGSCNYPRKVACCK